MAPGGLLALSSNIGHYSRDVVGFVPEVGAPLGYEPAEWVRLFVGYTFVYGSDVVRPGDALDFTVNPTRLPTKAALGAFGLARPAFSINGTDFWAQGIQLGAEFRY